MDFGTIFQWIFVIVYTILIVGTILVVFFENKKEPSETIAWLLVLIFLPAIGLILYYFFGQNGRKKRKNPYSYEDFYHQLTDDLASSPNKEFLSSFSNHISGVNTSYSGLANLLTQRNESWVWYGSNVEVIITGQRKFEALLEDIENAKHHIHIEYFYFRKDETGKKVKNALMKKATEGVEVRFIYENIANIDIFPKYYTDMKKAGVQVVRFTKISLPWARRQLNYRDHRKIVVIDGKIGYTGGMNVGDEYAFKWRDTHLRILGQGVYPLQGCFLYTWNASGGKPVNDYKNYFLPAETYSENLLQIVSESPASEWPYLHLSFIEIINHAKDYIFIQTPYYIPSSALMTALQSAALKGVDVRLMVPRKADFFFMNYATQSYYAESLRAGIRIVEYQDAFIHSKTLVSDDYMSVIGSANMDFRSLELSFEINAYMYDKNIALHNKAIFFDDLKNCEEVIYEEWQERPWWRKVLESVMRLFSSLL